ncbi:unnamed protein product [Symbiodinium sp. CCMP2592]|nr:unnamed protein product [Symbiodinium sp. CCMP2592]
MPDGELFVNASYVIPAETANNYAESKGRIDPELTRQGFRKFRETHTTKRAVRMTDELVASLGSLAQTTFGRMPLMPGDFLVCSGEVFPVPAKEFKSNYKLLKASIHSCSRSRSRTRSPTESVSSGQS